jgi:hypothetical protein
MEPETFKSVAQCFTQHGDANETFLTMNNSAPEDLLASVAAAR